MVKMFILLQLLTVALCAADECTTCPFGYILNPIDQTCLRFGTQPMNWHHAKAYCEVVGEHLVTFKSLESASWFVNLQQTNAMARRDRDNVWIGGYKNITTGQWTWDGQNRKEVKFSMWVDGQPDNGDGELCMESDYDVSGTSLFNDAPCSRVQNFICAQKKKFFDNLYAEDEEEDEES